MSAAALAPTMAMPSASRLQCRPGRQQRPASIVPQQQRRQPLARPLAALEAATNGAASSPVVGSTQQQHVVKMVNLVHRYFDELLTQGNMRIMEDVLHQSISHKDMVRNVGRVGMKEYSAYLLELHKTYPDYYVRPTNFGFVDNRSLFVQFEGQVSASTPKFFGVDLFHFNDDATKITEVQVYRSNWLGAQGHEERKKLAAAAARVEEKVAATRGQLP